MSDKSGLPPVSVVVEVDASEFKKNLREAQDDVENFASSIEKETDSSQSEFDALEEEISQVEQKLQETKSQIKQTFSELLTKTPQATMSVYEMGLELGQLSPELENFRKGLELLTMNKLQKEVVNTEAEYLKLLQSVEEFQEAAKQSDSPEWIKVQQDEIAKIIPLIDEKALQLKLIEEQIEKLNNSRLNKLQDEMKNMSNTADKSLETINKGMKKQFRNLKRLAVALIGIRTFWALVTRAVRSYIDRNEKMKSSVDGIVQGLGQVLAPAAEIAVKLLQFLTRWLAIAIAYVFTFINTVFGTAFAITLSAKSMKRLTDNTKRASNAAKKLLAPFDELNILTDNTTSETPEIAPDFTPFNIEEQLPSLEKFRDFLTEYRDLFLALTIGLGGFLIAMLGFNAIPGIIAAVTSPFTAFVLVLGGLIALTIYIATIWDTLSEGQKVALIILGLATAVGILVGVIWAMNIAMTANPIGVIIVLIGVLIGIIAYVIIYWDDLVASIVNGAKSIGLWFGSIGAAIKKVFTDIGLWALGVWESIKTIAGNIGNAFKNAFDNALKFARDKFDSFIKWIKNAFNLGGQIFSGIVDGISSIFKTVVNAIISGINTVVAAPINTINKALNSIRGITILGLSPFKGLWGNNPIPVPKIPQLYKGAVVTGNTIANIGEGRYNEAVIPLGQSPQFKDMKADIAQMVIDSMPQSKGGPSEIVIQLDKDVLGRASISSINDYQRKIGRTLLVV